MWVNSVSGGDERGAWMLLLLAAVVGRRRSG
jgi:MYXO-CTERM domain-containing protein